MSTEDKAKETAAQAERTLIGTAKAWGDSSLPPGILATLIFPLAARPLQPLPMLFPPVLLFTSYLNLQGFIRDAAGISAAWSGIYLLLAMRRKPGQFVSKFGARGLIRGATMGLAAANLVGGGVAYLYGDKERGRIIGGGEA